MAVNAKLPLMETVLTVGGAGEGLTGTAGDDVVGENGAGLPPQLAQTTITTAGRAPATVIRIDLRSVRLARHSRQAKSVGPAKAGDYVRRALQLCNIGQRSAAKRCTLNAVFMAFPPPQASTPDLLAPAAASFDDGYRVVFERNPTPMWVLDLDTHRFLAVNTAAVEEYGYPPEKFLTLTIRDVYGEADLARFDHGLASGAQELYSGLWSHRRRDGSSLSVEICSNDLTFRSCRARLIHATNVTARLQGEQSRRESDQLLGAIVESSDDAILSETPEGRILTWNAAAEHMYGYTSGEAIGASVLLIVPPENHADLLAQLETVRHGVRIAPYETARVHKDGHHLSVSIAISPIVNRAGAVVGISSIARDITEWNAMSDQLRQTQKMQAMGSLAGGIAHDFNNLLTVIIGMSELVLGELDPASTVHADVEEIRLAGQSATLLTRQLLTFSRKGIVQEAIVDLNSIVTRFDKMLRRTLGEDLEYVVRQTPDLWCVRADPSQLEQVLMNLVLNARDAMPDGGTLSVDTDNIEIDELFVAAHPGTAVGAFMKLTVTDTGCGMTPEVCAQIFKPFFTTKGPTTGTGLGLSTVFGIVHEAGGFIAVQSQPGTGTSFRVYLPHAVDGTAPIAAGDVLPIGRGTETILLVEDDNNIRALGARGLRRHGYTVVLARHTADALKVAKGYPGKIDLLLTDIIMPGAHGRTLAEGLLKSISDLKVLYTSGYTDSVATLQAIRRSSADFIQKPYTPDSLARKVREVLDEKRIGPL
jgi:two-component system cell cycle sensor histidine kinase/response regulator CckA